MSDNEDANSRRAARPTTPPFRGPAAPAGRPPLTPPAGGASGGRVPTPGPAGTRSVPPSPFAVPPAGTRGRPATPSQGARRPAATPARPLTPAELTDAIPAYGTPAPPSVAATLKSIAEFTIVEEPAEAAAARDAESDLEGVSSYEPPTITAREGDAGSTTGHTTLAASEAPGVDFAHDAKPGHPLNEEAARFTPTDLDAMVTMPEFEADRLFESHQESEGGSLTAALERGADAVEEVLAAAFESDDAPFAPAAAETAALPGYYPVGEVTPGLIAAEALEEVARSLRAGEIPISGVDPAADPAATLAAVLAAMLSARR